MSMSFFRKNMKSIISILAVSIAIFSLPASSETAMLAEFVAYHQVGTFILHISNDGSVLLEERLL